MKGLGLIVALSLVVGGAGAVTLREACKVNPGHEICREREAKREAAKVRREAKKAEQVRRVMGEK